MHSTRSHARQRTSRLTARRHSERLSHGAASRCVQAGARALEAARTSLIASYAFNVSATRASDASLALRSSTDSASAAAARFSEAPTSSMLWPRSRLKASLASL